MGDTQAQRDPSPLAGEAGRGGRRESGAPGFGFDFADEIAGREADRAAATSDGWKIILTIAAMIAIITAVFLWHVATAGLEPKREDRLTPAPLPQAFCTAPPATAEAG